MLRFFEIKVAKRPIKIWDVNIDNTVILKSVETKNNSRY